MKKGMTVVKTETGWSVIQGQTVLAGPFDSNALAWRELENLERRPLWLRERSENKVSWS